MYLFYIISAESHSPNGLSKAVYFETYKALLTRNFCDPKNVKIYNTNGCKSHWVVIYIMKCACEKISGSRLRGGRNMEELSTEVFCSPCIPACHMYVQLFSNALLPQMLWLVEKIHTEILILINCKNLK